MANRGLSKSNNLVIIKTLMDIRLGVFKDELFSCPEDLINFISKNDGIDKIQLQEIYDLAHSTGHFFYSLI